jgi:uncharacterized protein (DUF4415 family)
MKLRKRTMEPGSTTTAVNDSETVQVRIPLDDEVIDHFKRGGRDWQKRINDTLRRAMERERKRAKV